MKGERISGHIYSIAMSWNEVQVQDLIAFARSREVRDAVVADGHIYIEYRRG